MFKKLNEWNAENGMPRFATQSVFTCPKLTTKTPE